MLSEAALVALVRRFQASLAVISDRTALALALSWDRLGSYDEADIARFVEAVAPATTAGKRASVRLAGGFYSALGSSSPVGVESATVPVEAATRDPFIAHWRALKMGNAWEAALLAGRGRAEAVGADLVVRSARRTGDIVAEATGQRVAGWRRVLTGKSCTWCATVARQRYRSSESADFGHHHCDCSAVPIYGDRDPGRVINAPRHGASHPDTGGTS